MQLIFTKEEIKNSFKSLGQYVAQKEVKFIRYLSLGDKVLRVISYSNEFLPHIEKQLTYIIKETESSYDATLILWKEQNFSNLAALLSNKFNPKLNMRLRIEMMYAGKQSLYSMQALDNSFSKTKPVINIEFERGFFTGNDYLNNTYYYGVRDLNPEEFIKEGHVFVQIFNNILKTPDSNLVHGAVIGLNGNGILLCARGQRGKSTLSVLSMIKGFEYVSDDYLILHRKDDELLASPIYSIITLSPEMYNKLYDYLDGVRFISNNARKDKYVFNISNFHNTFRKDYPIKLALFPEIVSDSEPSISLCTYEERGRAIVQLIQSTLMQTSDLNDTGTVLKLIDMVKNLTFYKFKLCSDIEKNTCFLREFMNEFTPKIRNAVQENKFCVDITFDIANILNIENGQIYSLNKFGTDVFINICKGISLSSLAEPLRKFENKNPEILQELRIFYNLIKEMRLSSKNSEDGKVSINPSFANEDNYRLSFISHSLDGDNDLILKNKENKNELCIK